MRCGCSGKSSVTRSARAVPESVITCMPASKTSSELPTLRRANSAALPSTVKRVLLKLRSPLGKLIRLRVPTCAIRLMENASPLSCTCALLIATQLGAHSGARVSRVLSSANSLASGVACACACCKGPPINSAPNNAIAISGAVEVAPARATSVSRCQFCHHANGFPNFDFGPGRATQKRAKANSANAANRSNVVSHGGINTKCSVCSGVIGPAISML